MLLIYEHIKAHSIGKFLDLKGKEENVGSDSNDSQCFFDTKHNEGLHYDDEGLGLNSKGKGKHSI